MALLRGLKADLWVKEGNMMQSIPHDDSLCMTALDYYKPLCLCQGITAFKRHHLFSKCASLRSASGAFISIYFSDPVKVMVGPGGGRDRRTALGTHLGESGCLPRAGLAEPRAASLCSISPSELIFSKSKLLRCL